MIWQSSSSILDIAMAYKRNKNGLTPKQQVFADEWLVDRNGTKAYRVAYTTVKSDKVAGAAAARMLINVRVASYIKACLLRIQKKNELNQERVLKEEACIGLLDPANLFDEGGKLLEIQKMPEHVRRAISGMDVKPDGTIKIKFNDKGRSLERVSKHLGLYAADNAQQQPMVIDMDEDEREYLKNISVAAVKAFIAEKKRKAGDGPPS